NIKKKILFLSEDSEEANVIFQNLTNFLSEDNLIIYQDDLLAFKNLIKKEDNFILLLPQKFLSTLVPENLKDFILKINKNQYLSYETLKKWLFEKGYHLTDLVLEEGEFAYRGSIIDIFPLDTISPIRIEFENDKIISIRYFDEITQKSISEVEEIEITAVLSNTKNLVPLKNHLKNFLVISNEIIEDLNIHYLLSEEGINFSVIPAPNYLGDFSLLKKEIETSDHFYYLITENYLPSFFKNFGEEKIKHLSGSLSEGFVIPELKITVLTEKEIFGFKRRKYKRKSFKGLPIDDLFGLVKGEYVVHQDYGVGIFKEVTKKDFGWGIKEYLVIEYQNNDLLYLPVENFNLLERYVGIGEEKPTIDKLGTPLWQKTKEKILKECEKLASEILEIAAKRKLTKREPYIENEEWEKEIKLTFPYKETFDQLKVLSEIKKDLQKTQPMERLVCGDTGFGKTEIALRTALIAVSNFKQVAFLCPTTLLAVQHYQTFKKRLKYLPIRVEMLSRITPKDKEKEIIKDLKNGKIDIIIGTQKILQEDIQFANLGLLIIDDEHKFGVKDKEKLKKLKPEIDILSLTATPIPRTLYLALSGLKNISVINTPPVGRKDVITKVIPWDDKIIKEIIEKELKREGQVFFVHNQIKDLDKYYEKLKALLPEVKFGIAHGKLSEKKLSEIYYNFLERKYDVLISTVILESGIDMPNVNTIIVNNAERFGLADLHQLRGRVGRGEIQGYAYFIVNNPEKLNEKAKKRLSTLLAYAHLGSGMRIALRDLELRGAGELLGKRQHGNIKRVGLALYTQLLKEAIQRLKNEMVTKEPLLKIDLPAYIPEEFINNAYQRIALYQRLLRLNNEEELEELILEIKDRYGNYPKIMENLFKIAKIRILAFNKGIDKITYEKGIFTIEKQNKSIIKKGNLEELIKELKELDL
ncbi:MAG: transcription-repair coupling factor, partial [candidate division WOR-3 bacterium]|nr:transcription-repair coupling factor [candidate division WOR-3 bacterium]